MKSLFKLSLLLFSLNITAHARDVILVENLSTKDNGIMLMKILQEKFNIPLKLITFKNVARCNAETDALMLLCLKADGVLDIVKMNKFVVENTLRVFIDSEEQ